MDIVWLAIGVVFFIGSSFCVQLIARLHPEE